MLNFLPAVFSSLFPLQLVPFCRSLQLLQSGAVKQSTEREMKSFSNFHKKPDFHAHKPLSKILQNLCELGKSTTTLRNLCCHSISFLAAPHFLDLRQYPVKSSKKKKKHTPLDPLLFLQSKTRKEERKGKNTQICHYVPNYKWTRQSLMRQTVSAVLKRSNLFFRPPVQSRSSP